MDRSHAPYFLENPAENGIVIFIHGFMGSPRQFDKLAAAVQKQGRSAAALLLPGHGGSVRDFAAGTSARWQDYVDAEVESYSRDYADIWLAGHSMGGLLAINAAVRHGEQAPGMQTPGAQTPGMQTPGAGPPEDRAPEERAPGAHIRGIFTIACPFKLTTFSAYTIRFRIKQVFSRKDAPARVAYLDGSSVRLSPGLLWSSATQAVELKKLMSKARGNLLLLRAPVFAAYSTSDELTSIQSLDIFRSELSGAPFEHLLLTDSLHAYYPEHEQTLLESSLLSFLQATASL